MTEAHPGTGLSIHRSEALTDGIFAVAMTLLVIELKLPDRHTVQGVEDLTQALLELAPKGIAWLISFFVLAIFWFAHHRAFSHVRKTDTALIWLNLGQLAFVSLMPFSCALVGEYAGALASQVIYAVNMTAISIMAWLCARHIHRHADATAMSMPLTTYRAVRFRLSGLMLISASTVGVHLLAPGFGNMAYMLMAVIMPLSRRIENRHTAAAAS